MDSAGSDRGVAARDDDARDGGIPRWLLVLSLAGSAAAIALRIHATVAAGPLWRDEAGSASTATVATLAELWARQPLDSFPLLWQLVLRLWTTVVWDGGDVAIRSLGLIVALLLVPALWWTSRAFGVLPLASLAFAGVAPTVVVWAGFQNRAYGLGVALLALLTGAVWRMAAAPSLPRVALATLLALLVVHTTYHLPVMLAALLGAAVVVGTRRRAWSVLLAAGGVGAVAAASLLVYAGVLAQTRGYAKMVYAKVSLASVLRGFEAALAPGGRFVVWAFALAALGTCAWGAVFAVRTAWSAPPRSRARQDAGDAVAFAATTAALALVGQVAFLLYLRFLVQPWYYATVVLVVAIAADVVVQRGVTRWGARDAIVAALVLVLVGSTVIAFGVTGRRLSNLDRVATYLEANAQPGDLIVVYPWHWGVSFARYYDGAVPFVTVPDVADHAYHRFDQLEQLMLDPERIKPGFRRIHQTLQGGHAVWVVGRPVRDVPEQFPVLPPPAEADPASWRDGYYTAVAGLQLAWVLQQSSPQATELAPLVAGPVSDYEDASVTRYAVASR